ncbi:uncharacterized protein V1518DRAFT_416983 [Limtongia smithiae]|uniref:uncharacterized protein n=1 Tax=Limtongia smithiae TaxID=1125753 RepID=UPI0034CD917C
MSAYTPRAAHVAHYIAQLNALVPDDDDAHAAQQQQQHDDLSLFTNTQFFDFDMGRSTDASVAVVDMGASEHVEERRRRAAAAQAPQAPSGQTGSTKREAEFDFLGAAEYIDYAMPPDIVTSSEGQQHMYVPVLPPHHTHNPYAQAAGTPATPAPATPMGMGLSSSGMVNMDEASRAAAEEDKRRRNTAASARFRVKKKQREQQMERTTKDLQDKVQQLEAKILQLEMENKWLKNLVVEKNEAKAVSEVLGTRAAAQEAGEKS